MNSAMQNVLVHGCCVITFMHKCAIVYCFVQGVPKTIIHSEFDNIKSTIIIQKLLQHYANLLYTVYHIWQNFVICCPSIPMAAISSIDTLSKS